MGRFSTRAAELSERLAQNAQAVCRHYLPAGRREGRYWMVGDVAGTPGRSLYVRLFETERGAIGNWVDAATGEHGDLVDLIRLTSGMVDWPTPSTRPNAFSACHHRHRTMRSIAAAFPNRHEQDRQQPPYGCSPPRSR